MKQMQSHISPDVALSSYKSCRWKSAIFKYIVHRWQDLIKPLQRTICDSQNNATWQGNGRGPLNVYVTDIFCPLTDKLNTSVKGPFIAYKLRKKFENLVYI